MIAALKPAGGLGRAVKAATLELHRYAATITHVDTGALRGSHRMRLDGARGEIFLDPSAQNPRSGVRTAEYGPEEHDRGGGHAFYERTVIERSDRAGQAAIDAIKEALP